MTYVSFSFFFFVALSVAAYYLLPRRLQPWILLGASLVFYGSAGLAHLVYFLILAVLSFLTGRRAHQRKKRDLVLYLLLAVGTLVVLKNTNYVISRITILLNQPSFSLPILLPLGVSFFTLQAVGYVLDVYRGKLEPERHFGRFLLFLVWFPGVVQGPISRYDQLAHQLWENHSFDYVGWTHGLQLALWGLFKKLVVANRAGLFVDVVFGDYQAYSGLTVAVAALLYTAQIYADFSGCVDLCRGVSALFGVELRNNFDHPYFATSVRDFWQRWHISLSSWLRDYVYIPLGGNRRGTIRKYGNLMITFLVSGLWHGSGVHYLLWGMYHAGCQILGAVTSRHRRRFMEKLGVNTQAFSYRLGQQLITFGIIAYSWLLFRAEGMHAIVHMTRSLFTDVFSYSQLSGVYGQNPDFPVLLLALGVMWVVSVLQTRMSIRKRLSEQNLWLRWLCYLGLLFATIIFGIYGDKFQASDFLYMQF